MRDPVTLPAPRSAWLLKADDAAHPHVRDHGS